MQRDVIVVGAGFTGLVAATELKKAGLDVLLVEARGRVGGRVEAHQFADGTKVDTGGQFLCRDMPELMGLAQRHGKALVWSHVDGEMTSHPPLPPGRADELWDAVDGLRSRMIAAVPADPAGADPDLAQLTVSQWLDRQTDVPGDVADAFRRMVKGLWCRSPDEISLVYLSSNDRRVTNDHPELELFLQGTMHDLADSLAEELGDSLRLTAPVTEIDMSGDAVRLTIGTEPLQAARVLLAVPPVMARRLSFVPALPAPLAGALSAWSPGLAMKFNIRYPRPFWRDRGLNGMVMWHRPQGMFACDASHGDYCGLIVFVGGPLAQEWHSLAAEDVQRIVVGKLAEALGDEAGNPSEICLRDWVDDPWSDGAYSDVITDLAAAADAEAILVEGLPPLFFAASELSPSFPCYVEGAIVAGKRAAQAIRKSLAGAVRLDKGSIRQ